LISAYKTNRYNEYKFERRGTKMNGLTSDTRKLVAMWHASAKRTVSTLISAHAAVHRLTLSTAMAWQGIAGERIPEVVHGRQIPRLVMRGLDKSRGDSRPVILRRLLRGRGHPEQRTLHAELLMPRSPNGLVPDLTTGFAEGHSSYTEERANWLDETNTDWQYQDNGRNTAAVAGYRERDLAAGDWANDWPQPQLHSPTAHRGIFCLETAAWGPGDTTTVFDYLQGLQGIPIDGRKVENSDQFLAGINEWVTEYAGAYPILYLAFHGDAGQLIVGDYTNRDNCFGLRQIEDYLSSNGADGILYFASCGTMGLEKKRLQEFLANTRFAAVCGYRGRIDWNESADFDQMLLSKLGTVAELDGAGLNEAKAFIKLNSKGLYQRLKFKMVIRD
jgi:hypothetical protein